MKPRCSCDDCEVREEPTEENKFWTVGYLSKDGFIGLSTRYWLLSEANEEARRLAEINPTLTYYVMVSSVVVTTTQVVTLIAV